MLADAIVLPSSKFHESGKLEPPEPEPSQTRIPVPTQSPINVNFAITWILMFGYT